MLLFEGPNWPKKLSDSILHQIRDVLSKYEYCNVVITGGRSVVKLYEVLAGEKAFKKLSKVNYYLSDERCVLDSDPECNYSLIMNTLFCDGIPSGCTLNRIKTDLMNPEAAAQEYEDRLPKKIDILLISMGEDGHVASIFPENLSLLKESCRRVAAVWGPKYPYQRITITPSVIMGASKIFVLAVGPKKSKALQRIRYGFYENNALPASLAVSGVWFTDVG